MVFSIDTIDDAVGRGTTAGVRRNVLDAAGRGTRVAVGPTGGDVVGVGVNADDGVHVGVLVPLAVAEARRLVGADVDLMNIRDLKHSVIKRLAKESEMEFDRWWTLTQGKRFGRDEPLSPKEIWEFAFAKGTAAILKRVDAIKD